MLKCWHMVAFYGACVCLTLLTMICPLQEWLRVQLWRWWLERVPTLQATLAARGRAAVLLRTAGAFGVASPFLKRKAFSGRLPARLDHCSRG